MFCFSSVADHKIVQPSLSSAILLPGFRNVSHNRLIDIQSEWLLLVPALFLFLCQYFYKFDWWTIYSLVDYWGAED
jgi:hypothetical protein